MARGLRTGKIIPAIFAVLLLCIPECCAWGPIAVSFDSFSNATPAAATTPAPVQTDNRPYLSTGVDFNTFAFIGGILILAGMLAGIGRKKE